MITSTIVCDGCLRAIEPLRDEDHIRVTIGRRPEQRFIKTEVADFCGNECGARYFSRKARYGPSPQEATNATPERAEEAS